MHRVSKLSAAVAATLALFLAPALAAQSVPMVPAPRGLATKAASPPPLRLAEEQGVPALARLRPARTAALDQLDTVLAWNSSEHCVFKNGFPRPLPIAKTVRFSPAALDGAGLEDGGAFARTADGTVWGAQVEVAESWRLRLHLADVHLPAAARLWVYGDGESFAGPFGIELVGPEGDLWTPSVAGPTIRLEVELPDAAMASGRSYDFTLDRVVELVELDAQGAPIRRVQPKVVTSCIEDASCYDTSDWQAIDKVRHAIAQLTFIKDGSSFLCSGGLMNDTDDSSFIPYLLTSNDCFSTQEEASSLEATWDWYTSSCNGTAPSFDSRPKSFGATLLATGVSSDYTLARLNGIPGGRVFLGWNADPGAIGPDSRLHRLSYPAPDDHVMPQAYSRSTGLLSDYLKCGTDPDGRPFDDPTKFLHHDEDVGGTFPGSFGAPLILDGPKGWAVGQLWCHCGTAPHEGCDKSANDTLDGAFSNTYFHVAQYLDPEGTNPPPPYPTWLSSPDLPGFEAQVRITANQPIEGNREGDCIAETLCASGALSGRPEVFIKVIGPRPNGFLWVQLIRFTPSMVEVWLRQTSTRAVKYYRLSAVEPNAGVLSGLEDREAFNP